jgi:hypothetical protein
MVRPNEYESATHACELSEGKNVNVLATLAAAYAESGRFEKAVEWQEKANKLYAELEDVNNGEDRLKLYRENKPFRDQWQELEGSEVKPTPIRSSLGAPAPESSQGAPIHDPGRGSRFRAEFEVRGHRGDYTLVGTPGVADTVGTAVLNAVRSVPVVEGHQTVRLTLDGPRGSLTVVGVGETLPGAANMAASNVWAKLPR